MFRKYVTYDQDFLHSLADAFSKKPQGLGQIEPPAFLWLMAFTLVIFKKKNK